MDTDETTVEVPDYGQLIGSAVSNQDEERLGTVTALFADDDTLLPTWVAVRSGLFGRRHTLVPLAQTRFTDGVLVVPYSRDDLVAAPNHEPDVELSPDEERILYDHYNVGYSDADAPGPHTGVEAADTGLVASLDGAHPAAPEEVLPAAAQAPGVPGLPLVRTRLRLLRH